MANDSSHPVPVREQNVDANGNTKVHEQGTANVNVTNSSLSVAPPTPITGGADICTVSGGSYCSFDSPRVATALTIHMTSGIGEMRFAFSGSQGYTAIFIGPLANGNDNIVLALTRPIKFDSIYCGGKPADSCSVGWVGAEP